MLIYFKGRFSEREIERGRQIFHPQITSTARAGAGQARSLLQILHVGAGAQYLGHLQLFSQESGSKVEELELNQRHMGYQYDRQQVNL